MKTYFFKLSTTQVEYKSTVQAVALARRREIVEKVVNRQMIEVDHYQEMDKGNRKERRGAQVQHVVSPGQPASPQAQRSAP